MLTEAEPSRLELAFAARQVGLDTVRETTIMSVRLGELKRGSGAGEARERSERGARSAH